MESSKKLTLEERLSLAARTGKRKNGNTKKGSEILVADANRDEVKSPHDTVDNSVATVSDEFWETFLPRDYESLRKEQILEILKPEMKRLLAKADRLASQESHNESDRQKEINRALEEKNDIICRLRTEGEKLSKTELHQSTLIKELRSTLKQQEKKIKSCDDLIKNQNDECQDLRKKCVLLEKERKEGLLKLTQAENQTEKIHNLKKELQDKRGLVESLTNSYDGIKNEFAQYKEHHANDLSALKDAHKSQISQLETEMEKLRIELDITKNSNSKESIGSEIHHEDHINDLREEYASSKRIWEQIEQNLNDRIDDLEAKHQVIVEEKVRLSRELENKDVKIRALQDLNSSQSIDLEERNKLTTELRKEMKDSKNMIQSLQDDLELLRKKFTIQQKGLENKRLDLAQGTRTTTQKIPEEIASNILAIEDRLDYEWMRETELGFSFSNENGFDDPSNTAMTESKENSNSTEDLLSVHSIGSKTIDHTNSRAENYRDDSFPKEAAPSHESFKDDRKSSAQSIYPGPGNAMIVSKLSSELRRLETQVLSLEESLKVAQEAKKSAADEILRLLEENDKLMQISRERNDLASKLEDTQIKLEKALQLLGEKTEEVEELRNDVIDLKDMMHTQVQQLVEMQDRSDN